MAFKLIILFTTLVYARAGIISGPAAINTYAAAPALAYQAQPALAYQAQPALAYQAQPALAYQAQPALAYQAAAPAVAYHAAAPALAYQAAAPAIAYQAAPALAGPISYQAPAVTSQSSNIYRSFGNLGQVSTYSKTIDTPFSSVSKSDVRVSNPGVKFAATPAIAAPLAAAPVGIAYSAAPAVSHISYVSGYANYAF